MVGLPARGKSYITKKIQRYLSWQQHNSRIFNVGQRRRAAAGVTSPLSPPVDMASPLAAAEILLNGVQAASPSGEPPSLDLNHFPGMTRQASMSVDEKLEQDAKFFDPKNQTASKIREQVAMETLDELLDYLLLQNGAVGFLDATNSTIERRKKIVERVKEREPKLGILFIESVCEDQNVS